MDVTQSAPSYAATFAGGHADSVTRDVKRLSDWWLQLREFPRSVSFKDIAKKPLLLVLSENYARAMDGDLVDLASRGGDYLLVGGWRQIDGLPRLPANRDLRHALGGTVSSLSLRMAREWMARRTEKHLFTTADAEKWNRWARRVHKSEVYERAPMTDSQIAATIRKVLREQPGLSATRALRIVRDSGIACEQKRFGALFRDVAAVR